VGGTGPAGVLGVAGGEGGVGGGDVLFLHFRLLEAAARDFLHFFPAVAGPEPWPVAVAVSATLPIASGAATSNPTPLAWVIRRRCSPVRRRAASGKTRRLPVPARRLRPLRPRLP